MYTLLLCMVNRRPGSVATLPARHRREYLPCNPTVSSLQETPGLLEKTVAVGDQADQ